MNVLSNYESAESICQPGKEPRPPTTPAKTRIDQHSDGSYNLTGGLVHHPSYFGGQHRKQPCKRISCSGIKPRQQWRATPNVRIPKWKMTMGKIDADQSSQRVVLD
jgi:hypothetical protein